MSYFATPSAAALTKLHADGALAVYEYETADNRVVAMMPFVDTGITADCFDPYPHFFTWEP